MPVFACHLVTLMHFYCDSSANASCGLKTLNLSRAPVQPSPSNGISGPSSGMAGTIHVGLHVCLYGGLHLCSDLSAACIIFDSVMCYTVIRMQKSIALFCFFLCKSGLLSSILIIGRLVFLLSNKEVINYLLLQYHWAANPQ